MIKEAIQYIVGLSSPHLHTIHNAIYTDKQMSRVMAPCIPALEVHTLSAISEYINRHPDQDIPENLLLHIKNYNEVSLYGPPNIDAIRPLIINAVLQDQRSLFGKWHDAESFNIILQSCFAPNEHSAAVLKMIGNIADQSVKNLGDDGITQQVTVKSGISILARERVPNPVSLIPYRTFPEAKQPKSLFVLRVRSEHGVEAALFEADGGAWKNEAISNIKAYFDTAIEQPKRNVITILG